MVVTPALPRSPSSAPSRDLDLAGHDRAVRRHLVQQVAVPPHHRGTRPSTRNATSSARSRTSGLVVVTTVVRPPRSGAAGSAIRASVCASTAEVGSTSSSTSGSAASARTRTRRCRWPPENDRPRSVTCESGRQDVDDVLGRRRVQRGGAAGRSPWARMSSPPRRTPENSVLPVSDTTMRLRTHPGGARRGVRRPTARRRRRTVRAGRPRARTPRAARRRSRSARPGDPHAASHVDQVGARRRAGGGSTVVTSGSRASTRDPAGGHEGADPLVHRLGGGAQRDHEEGGVAVEGDRLTDRDLAGDREPRRADDVTKIPAARPGRVEHRLEPADLDARPRTFCDSRA